MSFGGFIAAHAWRLAGLVVLLACSAFFSGAETAFFSLSAARLLRFRQGAHGVGHVVASLMRRPHRLLMVILLGNQLVNVAFFALAAGMVFELGRAGGVAEWVHVPLVLLPLVVLVVFGEVVPKTLAVGSPGAVAQLVAVPLAVLVRVLGPVQRVLSAGLIGPLTRLLAPARRVTRRLTPAELGSLLELSGRHGLISSTQSAWLQEVIDLGRLKVADIMVPRVDVVAYDVEAPAAGLVELFRRTRLAKVPVYRGDLDETLGVIYAKQLLLSPQKPLAELLRPVPYVPEAGSVDRLLERFRKTRTQMAVVVDEYGGTAGLVTLKDALEEIVGDIATADEAAPEPVERISDTEYVISGRLAVREWQDAFGIELPTERISTIGGLVMSLLDRVPAAGDVARWGELEFTVESVQRRRIRRLRLRLLEEGR